MKKTRIEGSVRVAEGQEGSYSCVGEEASVASTVFIKASCFCRG